MTVQKQILTEEQAVAYLTEQAKYKGDPNAVTPEAFLMSKGVKSRRIPALRSHTQRHLAYPAEWEEIFKGLV